MFISILLWVAGAAVLIYSKFFVVAIVPVQQIYQAIFYLIAVILICSGFVCRYLNKLSSFFFRSDEPAKRKPFQKNEPKTWRCWKCDAENPADSKKCLSCGAERRY